MKISDILYGEYTVNEPVLVDIINSKTMQRLKGISCGGYYPAVNSEGYPNRFDHSIGVFLLLRKFNATIPEQIAGLIHDVSHSAFSHTIDYVVKSNEKAQDYQDSIHNNFIKKSEIPNILEKYGFSLDYILNDHNFPLKENDLPDICADRIDYSLRMIPFVYPNDYADKINKIVPNLCVINNSFAFKDKDSAYFYTKLFNQIDHDEFSGFKSAVMFSLSSKMLKYALDKNYLNLCEFYEKSDNEIITKLKNISDEKIAYYLSLLNKTPDNFINTDNKNENTVFCKVRRIDPNTYTETAEIKKVSDLFPAYKEKFSLMPKFKEYNVVYKKL